MSDLLSLLPQLPTVPFSNLLPSLERNAITVADLLTLDAADVAKRAQLPSKEVCRLNEAVLEALRAELQRGETIQEAGQEPGSVREQAASSGHDQRDHVKPQLRSNALEFEKRWHTISCLDEGLDTALGGGFPTGFLSEVTGESGAGKTHLLLSLLLAVQLQPPHGLGRNAVYISTEAALSTARLQQILDVHPYFGASMPTTPPVSLSRILTLQCGDLESQDHILRFQLPLAIRRHDVGLVVIDSITANFRAEFERRTGPSEGGQTSSIENGPAAMARRSASLIETAALLRGLAREYNIAVVVANQVADRFSHAPPPSTSASISMPRSTAPAQSEYDHLQSATAPPGPASSPLMAPDHGKDDVLDENIMTLDHQQRWFTGWGDEVPHRLGTAGMKTPSLGMVWTNQLAYRVALNRRLVRDTDGAGSGTGMRWQRHLKVVFAPWCADHAGSRGNEFSIEKEGLVSVAKHTEQAQELE